MRKIILVVCLSVLFVVGIAEFAQAYTAKVAYFFEGINLDVGKVARDTTALLIVCGDPPEEIPDLFESLMRETFPDFEPPVDFFFDYALNTESSIVFNPILPELEDESTYIAGMFVLWDTSLYRGKDKCRIGFGLVPNRFRLPNRTPYQLEIGQLRSDRRRPRL